jgi:hypothetical protein
MKMSQGNSLHSYVKQTKMHIFFYKNGVQEGKTGPVWGVGTRGRGEDIKNGEYGGNIVYTCVQMEK